jgi:predicted metalloenzyme YecM
MAMGASPSECSEHFIELHKQRSINLLILNMKTTLPKGEKKKKLNPPY